MLAEVADILAVGGLRNVVTVSDGKNRMMDHHYDGVVARCAILCSVTFCPSECWARTGVRGVAVPQVKGLALGAALVAMVRAASSARVVCTGRDWTREVCDSR